MRKIAFALFVILSAVYLWAAEAARIAGLKQAYSYPNASASAPLVHSNAVWVLQADKQDTVSETISFTFAVYHDLASYKEGKASIGSHAYTVTAAQLPAISAANWMELQNFKYQAIKQLDAFFESATLVDDNGSQWSE